MEHFVIKLEWETPFQMLNNEERGILLKVFFDFHVGRELNFEGQDRVEMAWSFLLPNIQRMNEKYLASKENGKKGGAPKGTTPWNKKKETNPSEPKANPSEPNSNQQRTLKEKEKEKEKEKVKENIKEKVSNKETTNREVFVVSNTKKELIPACEDNILELTYLDPPSPEVDKVLDKLIKY